ncbi:transaldolase [Sulfurimonas sp.]|uniref:transaldolase n=1 Tax=Sulfurimonas sp. TaxID=2022749 RepID=UPI0025CED1E2|nr:transaldolase [Sulfurimonas sp.]MDD5157478.1 transaldolase [Sulfurimonas sp.]
MYIKELKFSLWADFIEREYLDNEFKDLIKKGIINGATSNPAIFKSAILTSSAYKEQLSVLKSLSPKQKYEAVAIFDIQKAADILKPLYDVGNDGYVSIEVDPYLCDDADATIEEGKRLFKQIGRENVMIKIPATEAGYIAMRELVKSKIPVNATLIFKKSQALSCANAFIEGLKSHNSKVDTVISVFVSRIDRALDERLAAGGVAVALCGIYNSSEIYSEIEKMRIEGCRVLFASTGVKGNSLKPHYYIENLLAYNSVNTAPLDTIESFYNESSLRDGVLPISSAIIKEHFKKVSDLGIAFEAVLDGQIRDGLESFKIAFKDILEAL